MAAPTIVQQVFNSGVLTSTPSATFASTPTQGNRIVAIIAATNTNGVNTPTGWNYKKSNSAAGSFMAATQGVASTSAATTYSFVLPGNANWVVHLIEIAGAVGNSFADASAAFTTATTAYNASSLALNMYPVLNLGYFMPLTAGVTSTTPSGWTPNGSDSTTGITLLAFTETLSSGNGSMTGTLSTASIGYGFQVALSGEPSAGPWVNQVGSNTGTNAAPDANLAEATIPGNLLIALVATLGTPTAISGWTLQQAYTYGGLTVAAYSKVTAGVAGGYEYPATLAASASWACVVYEIVNGNTSAPLGGTADYSNSYTAAATVTWSSSFTPPANNLGLWIAASGGANEPAALSSPANFSVTDQNGLVSGLSIRAQHSVVPSTAVAVTPSFSQAYTSGSGTIPNLSALFYLAPPSSTTTITVTATSAVTGALAPMVSIPTAITSIVTEPLQATARATLVGTSAFTAHLATRINAALAAVSSGSQRIAVRAKVTTSAPSAATAHLAAKLNPPAFVGSTSATAALRVRVAGSVSATSAATVRPLIHVAAALKATSSATATVRARLVITSMGVSPLSESFGHAATILLVAAVALTARLSARAAAPLRAVTVASNILRAHVAAALIDTSTVTGHVAARVRAPIRTDTAGVGAILVVIEPRALAQSEVGAHSTAVASAALRATSEVNGQIGFRFAAALVALVAPAIALTARIRATLAAESPITATALVARGLVLVAHTVVTVGMTYVEIVRKLRAILADLFATVAALGELEANTAATGDLVVAGDAASTIVGDAEFLPIVDDGGMVTADEILQQTLDADGTLMDDLEADLSLADTLDAAPPILP